MRAASASFLCQQIGSGASALLSSTPWRRKTQKSVGLVWQPQTVRSVWPDHRRMEANDVKRRRRLPDSMAETISRKVETVPRVNPYSDLSPISRKIAQDLTEAEQVRAKQPTARSRRLGPAGNERKSLGGCHA